MNEHEQQSEDDQDDLLTRSTAPLEEYATKGTHGSVPVEVREVDLAADQTTAVSSVEETTPEPPD
ncbi:hypothetical protein [Actinokineospora sp. NBRC 105648]|uniref:hypothetical protein n=1 Tax=Actinokineospora sp. NBRC 105648 TaxID=3032206 RepID=UPI0025546C19|nr:hypothetical protein [Actinokineospora sp. NBRC 105648]